MEMTQVIDQAEEKLQTLRDEREALRSRLAVIDEEGTQLAKVIAAMKEAVAMFGSDEQRESIAPPEAADQITDEDWSALGRTVAVFDAVVDIDRPVGPSEIVRFLQTKGRTDDTIHLVSAALAYLQRQKKVMSLGRGRWVRAEGRGIPSASVDEAADELYQSINGEQVGASG